MVTGWRRYSVDIARFAAIAMLFAQAAHAGQASGPEPSPDSVGMTSGTAMARYQSCRSQTPADADLAEFCAELAIGNAEDRLPDATDGNEAFAGALGALGELALAALAADNSIDKARAAANDAAAMLALARADLLLDQSDEAATGQPLSASLAVIAANPSIDPGNLAAARRLWVESRLSSCAAYPVRVCGARYDALLAIFIDRAGLNQSSAP